MAIINRIRVVVLSFAVLFAVTACTNDPEAITRLGFNETCQSDTYEYMCIDNSMGKWVLRTDVNMSRQLRECSNLHPTKDQTPCIISPETGGWKHVVFIKRSMLPK